MDEQIEQISVANAVRGAACLLTIVFAVFAGQWLVPEASAPARVAEPARDGQAVDDMGTLALHLLRDRSAHLGRFRPTFYQTVDEAQFDDSGPYAPVRDPDGGILEMVPTTFHRRLCVEGAGRLRDGRVVTFASRAADGVRFRVTDAPLGLSHLETPLVPYRTVAVDPERIALGSLLFIPAASGIPLPDGRLHDGVFRADDIGGAIRGRMVDFFVGFEDHVDNRMSRSRFLRHGRAVEVYLVPTEYADALAKTHELARTSRASTPAGGRDACADTAALDR